MILFINYYQGTNRMETAGIEPASKKLSKISLQV